ncbi:MAG TPA: AMP-binding protein [Rubrivivax sp.]|nr:AMP-binding protein [Rubrivivax sp.]
MSDKASNRKLILDLVYEHETQRANQVYLTQPIGGGEVTDYTWAQVMDQARRMAAHLQSRGFPRGARVAILSKNCAHFFMTDLAIWMAGYTTVAIFPAETAETIRYVLEHSEASLLFVGKLDTWEHQKPGVPDGMPCIAYPLAPESALKEYETWDAIAARTQPVSGRPERSGDELAMLIYTSGSTGTPKGVMQSFDAVTAAATGFAAFTRKQIGPGTEGRVLSYLPLAHTFERSCVEMSSMVSGDLHVFFAEALETFVQDLQRARPTLFISVPRLYTKFQQGVLAKMPAKKLQRLLSLPIIGGIVGRKVRKGLGLDHVIYAASGSAPLTPEIIRWYRSIGLKLYEGYGMTEDNSYSHASWGEFSEPGYVGPPMVGVQVRLSEDGEVLIKSPAACSGYFKQPELTKESFTEDGFFRTGDLGERKPNGMLKITGRAKELFKTAKGKYVAPAPIENLLNAHPMVEMSMVSGVGQVSAYAIVVLAEGLRPRQSDPALRADVESELSVLLKAVNDELADYEQLRMIVVAHEAWSIENGMLTPTMKIRRARIEKAVGSEVARWFGARGAVIWA